MVAYHKRRSVVPASLAVAFTTTAIALTVVWGASMNVGDRYIEDPLVEVHISATYTESSAPRRAAAPKRRGPKHCFIAEDNASRKCAIVEKGVPVNGGGKSLPLVLGVGPAKTSSTALFNMVGQHDGVVLGDANLQGFPCCQSELYYFSRRFHSKAPAKLFAPFFNIKSKPNALWVAEKTPEYSDHFLAPYRVRATVDSSNLALVFTVREPVEAHVSLYFYRMMRKNLAPSAQDFLRWSSNLIVGDKDYQTCARRQLSALGWRDDGTWDRVFPLQTPSWVGNQRFDEGVFLKCRVPFFRPSDRLEGVGSLSYSTTLPRWAKVLSGAAKMCVFHEDFAANPKLQASKVATFLGLNPDELGAQELQNMPFSATEASAEERLFRAEGAEDEQIAEALRRHLQRLRSVFRGQFDFAKQFCATLDAENGVL